MDFSKVNWGLVTELYNFPTHRDRIPGILHPNKSSFGVWWGLCSGITFPDNFSGILGNGLFLSSSEHTCCKNIPLKFRKRRLSLFPQSLDFHPGFICNFLNRNKKYSKAFKPFFKAFCFPGFLFSQPQKIEEGSGWVSKLFAETICIGIKFNSLSWAQNLLKSTPLLSAVS